VSALLVTFIQRPFVTVSRPGQKLRLIEARLECIRLPPPVNLILWIKLTSRWRFRSLGFLQIVGVDVEGSQVDGEVRELQRVNHGLMSVLLPDAGLHDISLRYRPTYWRSSFVICMLGVFFAALYLRFSRRLGREAELPTPHGYNEVEADRGIGES